MHFLGVNLWAVLVCAVATMVVGFVWYSPALFANPWMKLMGYDPNDKAKIAEMQKSAGPSYALSMVASILTAFVLGKIISVAGGGGGGGGVEVWGGGGVGVVGNRTITHNAVNPERDKGFFFNK